MATELCRLDISAATSKLAGGLGIAALHLTIHPIDAMIVAEPHMDQLDVESSGRSTAQEIE